MIQPEDMDAIKGMGQQKYSIDSNHVTGAHESNEITPGRLIFYTGIAAAGFYGLYLCLPFYYYKIANTALTSGNYEEAKKHFDYALSRRPDWNTNIIALWNTYFIKKIQNHLNQEQDVDAFICCQVAPYYALTLNTSLANQIKTTINTRIAKLTGTNKLDKTKDAIFYDLLKHAFLLDATIIKPIWLEIIESQKFMDQINPWRLMKFVLLWASLENPSILFNSLNDTSSASDKIDQLKALVPLITGIDAKMQDLCISLIYYNQAKLEFAEGLETEAYDSISKIVINNFPEKLRWKVLYHKAVIAHAIGKYDDAINDLIQINTESKLLSICNRNATEKPTRLPYILSKISFYLALSYSAKGNWDDAESYFNDIAETFKDKDFFDKYRDLLEDNRRKNQLLKKEESGLPSIAPATAPTLIIPKHYEYAQLAELVHSIKDENTLKTAKTENIGSWQWFLEEKLDNQTGLFAVAFRRDDCKEITIVFRGTLSPGEGAALSDIPDSDKVLANAIVSNYSADLFLFFGYIHTIFARAKVFTELVKYERDSDSNYSDYKITFAGYSLGAALAEVMIWHENASGLSFDSPGTKHLIESMQGNPVSPETIKVISYQSLPNLINTARPHVGIVTQIYPQITLDERKRFDYNQWLKNLLVAFNGDRTNYIHSLLIIIANHMQTYKKDWADNLIVTVFSYIPENWWNTLREGIKVLANTQPVQWLMNLIGVSSNEVTKDNNTVKNIFKLGLGKILNWLGAQLLAYFNISTTDANLYITLADKILDLGEKLDDIIHKLRGIFNVLQLFALIINELVTHINPSFEKHKIQRIAQTLKHQLFQIRIFHKWPGDPVRYFLLDNLMQEHQSPDPYIFIGDPLQPIAIPANPKDREKVERQIEAKFNLEHSALYQAAAVDPYQEIPLEHICAPIRKFIEQKETSANMSAEEVKHQLTGGISEYMDCDSKKNTGAGLIHFGVFKYKGKAEQTTALEFLSHLNRSFVP